MNKLAENVNALLFLLGLALFACGVWQTWGVGVAGVATGVVVMTVAAWPYLAVRDARKP